MTVFFKDGIVCGTNSMLGPVLTWSSPRMEQQIRCRGLENKLMKCIDHTQFAMPFIEPF